MLQYDYQPDPLDVMWVEELLRMTRNEYHALPLRIPPKLRRFLENRLELDGSIRTLDERAKQLSEKPPYISDARVA